MFKNIIKFILVTTTIDNLVYNKITNKKQLIIMVIFKILQINIYNILPNDSNIKKIIKYPLSCIIATIIIKILTQFNLFYQAIRLSISYFLKPYLPPDFILVPVELIWKPKKYALGQLLKFIINKYI